MVSQILLFRQNMGNIKLFFTLAKNMLQDKEFFIRKAIGWGISKKPA